MIKKFFTDNNIPDLNVNSLNFKAWPLLRDFFKFLSSSERHFNEVVVKGDDYSLINCSGDNQIAHKDIWNTIRGFEEDLIYVLYSDTNGAKESGYAWFWIEGLV